MTYSQVFTISMYYVTVIWTAMILLPNWKVTRKVMSSFVTLIPLSILYVYYALSTGGLEAIISGFNPQLSQYTELFGQEGGALTVTIHMLAVDLFAGRWIYWQGQEKKIWTAHSLLLTVYFGPAGILSHLITVYFLDRNDDNESDRDESDDKDSTSNKSDDVLPKVESN